MRKCIVCETPLFYYNDDGEFCKNCGSVFATNMPTDEELAEYYRNFNIVYHGGGRTNGAENRQFRYAEKYLDIVNKFSNGKLLIDIGSSNNPFPNIAQSNGYNVTIVDYVKPQNLNTKITFINSNIEGLNSMSKDFDIVTAFAIIEHTKDPQLSLHILTNLCKINGIIVIYIPEIGLFADNYSLGTSKWLFPPEHLSLLSKNALIKIMEQNDNKLLYYKRFEINVFRYLIRYGIGITEGTIGYLAKLFFGERVWLKIRQKRKSIYTGLSIFVFTRIK
jgi:hypothetical protein